MTMTLCGGTLLTLLFAGKRQSGEKITFRGISGPVTEGLMMACLMKILYPNYRESMSRTFRSLTSRYKNCTIDTSPYHPFKEKWFRDAFHRRVCENYPEVLRDMEEYCRIFLWIEDKDRMEWLVKGILELICADPQVQENQLFIFPDGTSVRARDIPEMEEFYLPALLIGCLHYIVEKGVRNTDGRETIKSWIHEKEESHMVGVLNQNIGHTIRHPVRVANVPVQEEDSSLKDSGGGQSGNHSLINSGIGREAAQQDTPAIRSVAMQGESSLSDPDIGKTPAANDRPDARKSEESAGMCPEEIYETGNLPGADRETERKAGREEEKIRKTTGMHDETADPFRQHNRNSAFSSRITMDGYPENTRQTGNVQTFSGINIFSGAQVGQIQYFQMPDRGGSSLMELLSLNTALYHLFVAEGELFTGNTFSMSKNVSLNRHIQSAIRDRFLDLGPVEQAELIRLPAIFAASNRGDRKTDEYQQAILGRITAIHVMNHAIVFDWKPFCPFPQQILNQNESLFSIWHAPAANELEEEHWTIKPVPLIQNLQIAGFDPYRRVL